MSKVQTAPRRTPRFSMADFSRKRLLGGMSPARFLNEYWQKKPLLVRQALPGFGTWLNREGLSALACHPDAESRIVESRRQQWRLRHGPFTSDALARLPSRNWSLLVSGVNHFLPEADALLAAFDFVPRARLDDLMVSFAPDGGGVGPHFDSYDVFLIQGLGRRRWEISEQTDLALVEGAPLRILKNFTPTESWELEPGDMLYLPPKYAHNGIALGDCMTWSVGFRAPMGNELFSQFLTYLEERHWDTDGESARYADLEITPPRHPGELPAQLICWTEHMLSATRWQTDTVADFLGRYLSEPKPHVIIEPPTRPLSIARFCERAGQRGLRLDPRSQLLFHGTTFFLNGDALTTTPAIARLLRTLADSRQLRADQLAKIDISVFYAWYREGMIRFNTQ